jgi:hypothetical protein
LLVALPVAALAGNDYIEAGNLLRRNDPAGIEKMEKVCKNEPFASNAFLDLSRGYLRIKNDAAMAMDAALRGLEQYDEKWQYKVSKQALYDAFSAAAAKATPEALGQHVARIEKIAKRDGQSAQAVLAKFDAYRPAKLVPALAAQAQALQARGSLGQALSLYERAAEVARAGGLETELDAALKPGRELADKARQELADALKLDGQKRLDQLQVLAGRYDGHALGKEARAKLEELRKSEGSGQGPTK